MNNKPLILLVGPSGSGKTTIADILEKEHGMKQLRSYTTRKPRFDGEDGHIFVSDEEFDRLEDIIAYTEFDGHRYCATAEQANDADVYVIDPRGVRQMDRSRINKNIIVVGLQTADDVRIIRMMKRGDNVNDIIKRIENDKVEFDGYLMLCDYVFYDYEGLSPKSICNEMLKEIASIVDNNELYLYYPRSPCPFCGGDGIFSLFTYGTENSSNESYESFVACNKCRCQTNTVIKGSKDEALESAAELWNRRYKER